MSFSLLPLPHVRLADGSPMAELALNATVYVMTVGILGSLLWLAALAWSDRAR